MCLLIYFFLNFNILSYVACQTTGFPNLRVVSGKDDSKKGKYKEDSKTDEEEEKSPEEPPKDDDLPCSDSDEIASLFGGSDKSEKSTKTKSPPGIVVNNAGQSLLVSEVDDKKLLLPANESWMVKRVEISRDGKKDFDYVLECTSNSSIQKRFVSHAFKSSRTVGFFDDIPEESSKAKRLEQDKNNAEDKARADAEAAKEASEKAAADARAKAEKDKESQAKAVLEKAAADAEAEKARIAAEKAAAAEAEKARAAEVAKAEGETNPKSSAETQSSKSTDPKAKPSRTKPVHIVDET